MEFFGCRQRQQGFVFVDNPVVWGEGHKGEVAVRSVHPRVVLSVAQIGYTQACRVNTTV